MLKADRGTWVWFRAPWWRDWAFWAGLGFGLCWWVAQLIQTGASTTAVMALPLTLFWGVLGAAVLVGLARRIRASWRPSSAPPPTPPEGPPGRR